MQGYPPEPRPGPGGGLPRNGLGAATFIVVLLGALLAVFPASAYLGLLICVLAIVPAFVAHRRTRMGTATNRRRSLAAVALAPAFVVVAVAVGSAAAPPTVAGVGAAAREQPDRAPATTGQPVPSPHTADGAPTPPTAPATAAPATAGVHNGALAAVAAPAARPDRATTAQPVRAAAPKPAPKQPPKPAPPTGEGSASNATCDEATHYVNVSGNCVLHPVAAASAPASASAQCSDGTYSSSQHRRGTCSAHGGVGRWLKNLPN